MAGGNIIIMQGRYNLVNYHPRLVPNHLNHQYIINKGCIYLWRSKWLYHVRHGWKVVPIPVRDNVRDNGKVVPSYVYKMFHNKEVSDSTIC